jgi:hypothetical protein
MLQIPLARNSQVNESMDSQTTTPISISTPIINNPYLLTLILKGHDQQEDTRRHSKPYWTLHQQRKQQPDPTTPATVRSPNHIPAQIPPTLLSTWWDDAATQTTNATNSTNTTSRYSDNRCSVNSQKTNEHVQIDDGSSQDYCTLETYTTPMRSRTNNGMWQLQATTMLKAITSSTNLLQSP